MNADELIAVLRLEPHPEGGWYAETSHAGAAEGERAPSTVIYFLLRAGERSHWHRVDADEVWLFHAGDPLRLSVVSADGCQVEQTVLGLDIGAGERPHLIVPADHWQAAETVGSWTLVSCVVAPGFEFAGFELAEPAWTPA